MFRWDLCLSEKWQFGFSTLKYNFLRINNLKWKQYWAPLRVVRVPPITFMRMFEPRHNILSNVRTNVRKYVVTWLKHSRESNRPVPGPDRCKNYDISFSMSIVYDILSFFPYCVVRPKVYRYYHHERRLVAGEWSRHYPYPVQRPHLQHSLSTQVARRSADMFRNREIEILKESSNVLKIIIFEKIFENRKFWRKVLQRYSKKCSK